MKRIGQLLASHLILVALGFTATCPTAGAVGGSRGYSGTQLFSTMGADKDLGEPNHCGEPGGASSWFFYRAPRHGMMVVDTRGSSFDTVLAVYIGPGTGYDTLTNVACNNDIGPSTTWSQVVFEVTSNTVYYIAVDGVGGATGTVKLNYRLGDALAITSQPQSMFRVAGSPTTLLVDAVGVGTLLYQWTLNGNPLNGATQATLSLPAVQLTSEGSYSVLVQDAASQVNSLPAALAVGCTVPKTNCLGASQVLVDGNPRRRLVGHAAVGSIMELSEDLRHWTPTRTNESNEGLFHLDDPMDRPQRYFRLRLEP